VLAGPLSMAEMASAQLVSCGGGGAAVSSGHGASPGLLELLEAVPDPRSARGRRYRLATLLAIGVCALSASGHDSLAAVAEWARRADQDVESARFSPHPRFTRRLS